MALVNRLRMVGYRWRGRHSRLRGLLLLLVVLVAIAVPLFRVTLGWDMIAPVRRALLVARAHITFPLLARKDPTQGEKLPPPTSSQVVLGSLHPSSFKLVLFAGPVSPCSLKSLPTYRIVQKAHPNLQMVLVFDSPKSVVKQAARGYENERFVWVSDSGRQYASRLNAYYYPRVYLLDSEWRLVYVQHYRTPSQRALMNSVARLPKEVQ